MRKVSLSLGALALILSMFGVSDVAYAKGKPVADLPGPCAQVITYAMSPEGVVVAFPTPCDVPSGWVVV